MSWCLVGSEMCIRDSHDGLLGTFRSKSSQYSYARVDQTGRVLETAEKKVISDLASSGLYFFKSPDLFILALQAMKYSGEKFVAPLYNYLISQGYLVGVFEHSFVIPLGTSEEISDYLSKKV
jgi:dTDP-glucose pyrophosphorylase